MATINRVQAPIQNPLTLQNLRGSVYNSKHNSTLQFPGNSQTFDIGQQIGATFADPFGFKATIEGLQSDISAGIPGFLVGAAVLIVGVLLIFAGLQAFVLPAAAKVAGTVAKAAL